MKSCDVGPIEFTHVELANARTELSKFVRMMADQTRAQTGVDWYGASDAPNTWKALKAAWLHSQVTGEPLPVYDGDCDSVIFVRPEDNIAYRYWHDVTHLKRDRSFSNTDELDMANFHLWEAERHGLERGSLPWRLLHADAVGQVLHWAVLKEFVLNQRVFITNAVLFGVEVALLTEMARRGVLAPQVLPFGVDFTTDAVRPFPPSEWSG